MRTTLAFQLIGFYGVYAICFWVGLVFAIMSGIFSGVFHGIHADSTHVGGPEPSHGIDQAHDIGAGTGHTIPDFPAFSPVTIATFVTVFGGAGMIFSRISATSPAYFSMPLSVLCAFGVAYLVYLAFSYVFHSIQSSSEVLQSALVGQAASVIITIPASGCGEIAYVAGAGRQNAQARSANSEEIGAGKEVVIQKIVGGCFYVEPKGDQSAPRAP